MDHFSLVCLSVMLLFSDLLAGDILVLVTIHLYVGRRHFGPLEHSLFMLAGDTLVPVTIHFYVGRRHFGPCEHSFFC